MYKIGLIGGHFTTAKAVIDELLWGDFKIDKRELVFFGKRKEANEDSPEYLEVSQNKIKFVNIFAVKINRFLSLKNAINLIFLPLSIIFAFFKVLSNKPRVIIGFGGYLEIPVILSAKFLGIKIVIHEGTSRGGFSNRFLSLLANEVFISFNSSRSYFRKCVYVGFPLRRAFLTQKRFCGKIPIILITGGHLGSQVINKTVFSILEKLLFDNIVIHQTGALDFEKFYQLRSTFSPEKKVHYIVKKFFSEEEFAKNLINASVLIGRSGINTVSEIIYAKTPSVFIPLPFAQKNEQFQNAKLAEELGLAIIIDQKNLNGEKLYGAIKQLQQIKRDEIDNSQYKNYFENAANRIARRLVDFL